VSKTSSLSILCLCLSACLPPRVFVDDGNTSDDMSSKIVEITTDGAPFVGVWTAITPDEKTAYNDVTNDTRTITLLADGTLTYEMSSQDGVARGGCFTKASVKGTANPSSGRLNAVFSDGTRVFSGCTDTTKNGTAPFAADEVSSYNAILSGYDYVLISGTKLAIGLQLTRSGTGTELVGTWKSALFPYPNPSKFWAPNPTVDYEYVFAADGVMTLNFGTHYAKSFTFSGDDPANRLAGCDVLAKHTGTFSVTGNDLTAISSASTEKFSGCSNSPALNAQAATAAGGANTSGYFLRKNDTLVLGQYWSYFGAAFVKQ